MQTEFRHLFFLLVCMGLLAIPVAAQTFTNLHSFTGSDGSNPAGSLHLSGNTLYGTASGGGTNGNGAVFKVNTDGSSFTNLYSFTARYGAVATNSDGAYPFSGLNLSGNALFGTTSGGGTGNAGTVFRVNTDGTGFTNLHSFNGGSDGASPYAGLNLSGNTVYGTASLAGIGNRCGTVFAVNTDGTGFSVVHSFTAPDPNTGTNSDGLDPQTTLILSGNTLYGMAIIGGSANEGTVFAVNPNGTNFTTLYNFTKAIPGSGPPNYYLTNSDGANPCAGLLLSGNTLYGIAQKGGGSGNGTVFAVNTNGTGFTNLYSFTAGNENALGVLTNNDGANPRGGLLLSGNTLYGIAQNGGSSGNGTVFAVNTNGTGFMNMHNFSAFNNNTNTDGAEPLAGLILSGNTLYGTAYTGGTYGKGTVFSLTLPPPPQLSIMRLGTNFILAWPASYTSFTLQSATNLASMTVWSNVSPSAVVVNTNNVVTNYISGPRKFYRLTAP